MQFLVFLGQAAGCTPQGGSKGAGGGLELLLMMVVMIAVMYFIVYRPQMKQRKKLEAEINAMKKGDRVLTNGGLFGNVHSVKEKEGIVVVEIDRDAKVKVEVSRTMIARVLPKE